MNLLVLVVVYTVIISLMYSIASEIRLSHGGSIRSNNILDKRCIFLVFLPLLFLQTFKYTDSLDDLPIYEQVFEETRSMSITDLLNNGFFVGFSQEPGYILLNKIVSFISSNVNLLFGVVGFAILYCYAVSIYKYSPLVPLSCLLFVIGPFNQSLFVLRQHLAIALMIFGFQFIIQRRLKAFFLLFLISFFVHYTSIVFIPLYLLYGVKSNKKLFWMLLAIFVVVKLGMMFILNLATTLNGAYSVYVEGDVVTNYKVALYFFGILLVRFYFMKDAFWAEGTNKLFSIVLILGFIFYLCGIGFAPTSRLFMGYQMPFCIIIPHTLVYIRNRGLRFLIAGVFICGAFISYVNAFHYVENFKLIF